MSFRHWLRRWRGIALRALTLVALVLGGVFPAQPTASAAPKYPLQQAIPAEQVSLREAQQTSEPFTISFPLVLSLRDDLAYAESSLVVKSVSAGYAHNCAIRPDGALICWGLNTAGQSTPPPGMYQQVSAGADHSCALRQDGAVVCWGSNVYEQSTVPVGSFLQVSAGGYHTCAIRVDGTLDCWGWNNFGQLDHIPSGTFTQVSAGNLHTCAIRTDGTLACWGWNADQQAIPPAGTFTQISAGGSHSCAVRTDGVLLCWGSDISGQATVPAGSYKQVAAGSLHTCALRVDGTAVCWGSNGFGQLSGVPVGVFSQISAGGQHTCALRESGTLACWGWNRYGQSFPSSGVHVSAGSTHACAVRLDGAVTCWGDNDAGQLDAPGGAFMRAGAGDAYSCGISTAGELVCWGASDNGLLDPPTGVYLELSTGARHACALDQNGTITCWGNNSAGQADAPAGIYGQVAAGDDFSCALNSSGAITCWGSSAGGVLEPPTGVFTQISAGGQHACALKQQGTLACWGSNESGQTDVPVGTFIEVSAGQSHTCAVRADGAVLCWGDNSFGQADAPAGQFAQVSAGGQLSCAVKLDGSVTCWGGSYAPRISIQPDALADAHVEQPYSQRIEASGGTSPYIFTLTSGDLPDGLELSNGGVISGTPLAEGSYPFSVQVRDSSNPSFAAERAYTLRVLPAGVIDTTPPVITVDLSGELGQHGWYVGPVRVTWHVVDEESDIIATSGCEDTTLSVDTPGQVLTCSATSAGGTASQSVEVKIDQTPPVHVSGSAGRAPDHNGWYDHPLTVMFHGEDATSGIASCSQVTYNGPDSAAASVQGTCTDMAGNTSQPSVFTFQYDSTAPTLNPVVTPNPVYLNGEARVLPNVEDNVSGLGSVTCDMVDTSSVGLHTVTCKAADRAGNHSQATAEYNVIYRFDGFLPPVENPLTINRVVAGQTVPLKFRLSDANGLPVEGRIAFTIRVAPYTCTSGTNGASMEELYLVENGLKYQGNGLFHYNWQTDRSYANTCKQVIINLGEGPGVEHIALFQFRK